MKPATGDRVVLDRAPNAPTRLAEALLGPPRFQLPPVALRRRPAPLRRHPGHARAREAVQDQVAGLGVVEDRGHDRQVRHLGVIAVRPVDGMGLALADIDRERLATVGRIRLAVLAAGFHEFAQERVRARRMPRRVGEVQDGFGLAVGKADLVFPALEQVLGRVRTAHPFGKAAKLRRVAHRPVLDGPPSGPPRRRYRHTGHRRACRAAPPALAAACPGNETAAPRRSRRSVPSTRPARLAELPTPLRGTSRTARPDRRLPDGAGRLGYPTCCVAFVRTPLPLLCLTQTLSFPMVHRLCAVDKSVESEPACAVDKLRGPSPAWSVTNPDAPAPVRPLVRPVHPSRSTR